MKTYRTRNRKLIPAMAVALMVLVRPSEAGSVDHYTPGVMNIRDYLMPDPGVYGVLYNYYYTSDRLNDANGNRILNFHAFYEYFAAERMQGQAYSISLAFKF